MPKEHGRKHCEEKEEEEKEKKGKKSVTETNKQDNGSEEKAENRKKKKKEKGSKTNDDNNNNCTGGEENTSTLDFLGDVSSPKADTLDVIVSEDGYRGWDSRDEYDLDKLRAAEVPGYHMKDFIYTFTFLGNTSSNLAKKTPAVRALPTAVSMQPNRTLMSKRVIPDDFKQRPEVNKKNYKQ